MNKIKLDLKLKLLIDNDKSSGIESKIMDFIKTLPEVKHVSGNVGITIMDEKKFKKLLETANNG